MTWRELKEKLEEIPDGNLDERIAVYVRSPDMFMDTYGIYERLSKDEKYFLYAE